MSPQAYMCPETAGLFLPKLSPKGLAAGPVLDQVALVAAVWLWQSQGFMGQVRQPLCDPQIDPKNRSWLRAEQCWR